MSAAIERNAITSQRERVRRLTISRDFKCLSLSLYIYNSSSLKLALTIGNICLDDSIRFLDKASAFTLHFSVF